MTGCPYTLFLFLYTR